MASLYLMQSGRTTWDEQGRLESAIGLPLTEQAVAHVRAVAGELAGKDIGVLFCGTGPAERQTAELAGEVLHAKIKELPLLDEIDFGLWQGLTLEEIQKRQPSRLRNWKESPAAIGPPGGETLWEARERLRQALDEILKRKWRQPVLLVLRPTIAGLLRCLRRGENIDRLWQYVDPAFTYESFAMDRKDLW